MFAIGDVDRVREMVKKDPSLINKEEMGMTPLAMACQAGQAEVVGILLDAGAPLNGILRDGSTPLHVAAYGGHLEVVRLLLERGAKADVKAEPMGMTPLEVAQEQGYTEIVELLSRRPSGR